MLKMFKNKKIMLKVINRYCKRELAKHLNKKKILQIKKLRNKLMKNLLINLRLKHLKQNQNQEKINKSNKKFNHLDK